MKGERDRRRGEIDRDRGRGFDPGSSLDPMPEKDDEGENQEYDEGADDEGIVGGDTVSAEEPGLIEAKSGSVLDVAKTNQTGAGG
jgi:hypothetical protein